MRSGRVYGLFEVFGLELEYMIVDKTTLKVRSITDELIRRKLGEITSDVDNGVISWSNELTSHVVELKTTMPTGDLDMLSQAFHDNIKEINQLLAGENAMLMPTAAHPTMDPFTETKLWEHEYNEIYDIYNEIFDCRGHGWANLQSFHLNLPFHNDAEFEKLHAAIRILLPIIPAISASSPILDGKVTGYIDTRMETYLHHQKAMPSLMGKLIPEQVFSEVSYHKVIYDPVMKDIKPYDKNQVMEHHFLNSRGAIARFDRGAIEIRVIDVQECPEADLGVCGLIVQSLKALTNEQWCSRADQKSWHEDDLRKLFDAVIKDGLGTGITNKAYLKLFGIDKTTSTAGEIWQHIYNGISDGLNPGMRIVVQHILKHGNLSERILKKAGSQPSGEEILAIYHDLAECLEQNVLYAP